MRQISRLVCYRYLIFSFVSKRFLLYLALNVNFMAKKFLLILGMHRSGTSALTGLMSALGAFPGKDLLPPNGSNIKGYYENRSVVDLNNEILSVLGSSWYDMNALPLGFEQRPEMQIYKEKIATLIHSEYDVELPIIKDPRICILFPLWSSVFSDLNIEPCVIFVFRKPKAVANSQYIMKRLPHLQSLILYCKYNLSAIESSANHNKIFFSFEEFLLNPRGLMEAVNIKFSLDLELNVLNSSPAVGDFLDASLNHGDDIDPSNWGCSYLLNLCDDLYLILLNPNQDALSSWKRNYEKYLNEFGPWMSLFNLKGRDYDLLSGKLNKINKKYNYLESLLRAKDVELLESKDMNLKTHLDLVRSRSQLNFLKELFLNKS